ncbi:hypothetical protein CKO42_17375 [Lamprobacter modestohalophilus]|uniref:PIN-like domain-containing protein n=1 Tax=Lamprobacter modestohalophilus TaxID=1064514 RepID=A0A9X0WB47_9GAMM|nr:hypothetical protein [Lamprobacter modestohalophilus]
MNVILIDYEIIQPTDLAGLQDEDVRIVIFVGVQQNRIPFDFSPAMQQLGEQARYVKIGDTGRNALDFHLACQVPVDRGHNDAKAEPIHPLADAAGGDDHRHRRSASSGIRQRLHEVGQSGLRSTGDLYLGSRLQADGRGQGQRLLSSTRPA